MMTAASIAAMPPSTQSAIVVTVMGQVLDAEGVMPVNPPYYESRFVRANCPHAPQALWLRETLLLPTAGESVADVWVMVFDPDGAGNRAIKVGHPIAESEYRYHEWTARIGEATIDDTAVRGHLAVDGPGGDVGRCASRPGPSTP